MNTWARRSLQAGALTAGAVMATGAAAYASPDTSLVSKDNTGILNGTQIFAPIQAPINLCGVAIAVAGNAQAGCAGGSAASLTGLYETQLVSKDNTGILNGTQIFAPIQAPINLCGVAVSVLGDAEAGCEGGASARHGNQHHHGCSDDCDGRHHNSTESGRTESIGGDVTGLVGQLTGGLTQGLTGQVSGLLGGVTQTVPLTSLTGGQLPLVGPVLSGLLGSTGADVAALDSVGTLTRQGTESRRFITESEGGPGGDEGSQCGSNCPSTPPPPTTPPPPAEEECPPEHHRHKKIELISKDNTGILNGTQVYAPIQVPIDVSGVAVGVLGGAAAWSEGGASARQ